MAKSKYPRWQPDKSSKPWRNKKQEDPASVNNVKQLDMRKEFLQKFRDLTYNQSPFSVWSDFVTMSACSFSNVFDKENYAKREALYLSLIRKYDKSEQMIFPDLLVLTTLALEKNPEQDFLGSMFMELKLGNEHKGQFFTPYHVSELMAQASIGNIVPEVQEKGYITIHDPCCGAGAMLIAAANTAKARLGLAGLNFQNHVFITAQDIDQTVALMCYIQLSLLGVAGFIKVGNSLMNPITVGDDNSDYWFTPMYFSNIWRTRRMIDSFKDLMEGLDDGKSI